MTLHWPTYDTKRTKKGIFIVTKRLRTRVRSYQHRARIDGYKSVHIGHHLGGVNAKGVFYSADARLSALTFLGPENGNPKQRRIVAEAVRNLRLKGMPVHPRLP